MAGVYNPLRFRVISACEIGNGIVSSKAVQAAGRTWINLIVDDHYSKLLGPGNISHLEGQLTLGEVSGDQASMLSIGERISFVGPLVYYIDGEFNAIVPVWSITPY